MEKVKEEERVGDKVRMGKEERRRGRRNRWMMIMMISLAIKAKDIVNLYKTKNKYTKIEFTSSRKKLYKKAQQ